MFVKLRTRVFGTLTGRLTLTYTVLSGCLFILVILFLYWILLEMVYSRYDDIIHVYASEVKKVYMREGLEATDRMLKQDDDVTQTESGFIQLVDMKGNIISTSDISEWQDFRFDAERLSGLKETSPRFATITRGENKPAVRLYLEKISSDIAIVIVAALPDDMEVINYFAEVGLIAAGILLFGGALIGWFVARRAVIGIKEVTRTAMSIEEGKLDARVSTRSQPEEIRQLADTFNKMIERISQLIDEVREVTNVIAHDLRSPLTRIRGNAEVTLRGNASLEDYRVTTEKVIEECDRLEGMINTMLEIAAVGAGIHDGDNQCIDLRQVVEDALDLFEPLADAKKQTLFLSRSENLPSVFGNKAVLQRSIANLLDNAIKYTPESGKIEIILERSVDHIRLVFQDSGIGIPQSDLARVFQPFFRCDRSRHLPGNGLGLSYVETVIKNLGGVINVSCPDTGGTRFEIRLPHSDTA